MGYANVMVGGVEARNPGRSLVQSPSSSSAGGLGAAPGRAGLTPKVGAGDHPGKDAKTAPHRPLAARQSAPSSGDWSMVSGPTHSPLCGLPRTHRDRRSRNRVCTIATRNKTSHSSAQGSGGAISALFFGPFHAVLGGVQEFEFRN